MCTCDKSRQILIKIKLSCDSADINENGRKCWICGDNTNLKYFCKSRNADNDHIRLAGGYPSGFKQTYRKRSSIPNFQQNEGVKGFVLDGNLNVKDTKINESGRKCWLCDNSTYYKRFRWYENYSS